jgi:hypothetical protein
MPIFYRGLSLNPTTTVDDCDAIRQTGRLTAGAFWANTIAKPDWVRSRRKELAIVRLTKSPMLGNAFAR